MESQNISLHRPVRPKSFSVSPQTEMERHSGPDEQAAETVKKRDVQSPLELYGGAGNVRSEQPAARGNNIDITI